jgi:hypothetical protein
VSKQKEKRMNNIFYIIGVVVAAGSPYAQTVPCGKKSRSVEHPRPVRHRGGPSS